MINQLHLEQFRNYSTADFNFSPTTVILGSNGSGKTSILEAISLLSITSSWKTEKDSEVIKWGSPFTRILSEDLNVEFVVQEKPYMKRVKMNGVSKRIYQVIGEFPTVLFQPDDLHLFYGAPSARRHYLDRFISQTSPVYTRAILELSPILKQRNHLLKQIQEERASSDELKFWDEQLAGIQLIVQKERKQAVDFLQEEMPQLFSQMVPGDEVLTLSYQMSPQHQEGSFLEHLEQNRFKEIASGNTLYGPHREDLHIHWDGHLVEQSLSRGQMRSLLIACKIAELHYIEQKTDKQPTLLLDDIFSELDEERRARLFEVFGSYQVIMTTTELNRGDKERLPDFSTIKL